jgi:hypothetical protein
LESRETDSYAERSHLLWQRARARARGDDAALRAALLRVEAADHGEGRRDAAEAASQRAVLEVYTKIRAVLHDFSRAYPNQATAMVRTIAATGVDGKALDAELEWMLAHADEHKIDVNDITSVAEALGRFDVAARAAARAKVAKPDDPTAKALAASVSGYLGHPEVPRAALKELEAEKGQDEWQMKWLRSVLEQSIEGQLDPDQGPSFEPLFGRLYKPKDSSAVAPAGK